MEPILSSAGGTALLSPDGHSPEESALAKSQQTNGEHGEPVKIAVILPTNAYFMSGVRDFTKTVVMNMTGFSEQWAFRFQSVVDELTNNAIEFGSAPGQEIKVSFVSQKGKSIEVFVEDSGTGAQKKTAAEMARLVEERKHADPTKLLGIRGRGLSQIVANWTDALEFLDNEKGGLTVHVVKNLQGGETAAA